MNARKNIIKIFNLQILFVIAIPFGLLSQVSLDSCQVKALNNYPLIQQFDLIEQSKELTLSNANKAWLPQLDINLIGGVIAGLPSFSPTGSESTAEANLISIIQINQTIWDGGMTKANKNIIQKSSEIDKADLDVNLFAIEDRINNIYFGILLIDEQVAQLSLLLESLERNKKRVTNAVEAGTAYTSDLDELKVEIIHVNQKQIELRHNRQAYINVLSAMIGEPLNESEIFERPFFGQAIDSLDNNRPELRKFDKQRELIEAQAKLNKAMLMPKVGLLGFGVLLSPGVDFGVSSLTDIVVAGISVSWNLGPLYKNGNNKKLQEISLQRIQNQEETFLFNTNLELTQKEKELEKYLHLIAQDIELLKLKISIKDAYVVKYENGISTMSEMLDKMNDENVAKQNKIVHEIQYLMTAYQYLNKTGN